MNSKILLESKTFWVALIGLAIAIYNAYNIGAEFPPELAEKLKTLEWNNWGLALINTLIIIIRWYFTSKPIKGVFSAE